VIASCLETAAALLLKTGDAETAARLTGAEDELLEQINLSLHPAERRRRTRLHRSTHTSPTFAEELRAEGRRLAVDDATALALQALPTTADTG
jgi:hypothetical protein